MVDRVQVRQVSTRVRLADVRRERAETLVADERGCEVREVKVVVPLRISTERRVVDLGRDVGRRPALPASDHPGAEVFRTLLDGEVAGFVLDRVVQRVLVELGYQLLQLAECEEGTVDGPQWTEGEVAETPCEDHAGEDYRLTRQRLGVEARDGRVRNTIQEAEVCSCGENVIM